MNQIRALLERGLRALVEPVVAAFTRWKVHPNLLSTAGFLVTCTSGLLFHQHHVRSAGAVILLGGVFDLFDGTVARRTGLSSSFGAFYDSTLDRLSEIVVYLGLLSLYNDYRLELGDVGMIYTVLLAMAGSVMISYTRARAEGLGIKCTVGLMQRPERVILIGLAALLFGEQGRGIALKAVLVGLAVLTNFTVMQRMYWVWRQTRPDGEPGPEAVLESPPGGGGEDARGDGEGDVRNDDRAATTTGQRADDE